MPLTRRRALWGLLAAPAIVPAASLMPVRVPLEAVAEGEIRWWAWSGAVWTGGVIHTRGASVRYLSGKPEGLT